MPEMSIGRAVTWLAEQQPEAVAVRCGEEVWSRTRLDAATTALALRWRDDGLGVDDVVSVALPNGVDFVLACVAAWKAGATVQPLSPRLAPAERAAILALTGPALVVGPDWVRPSLPPDARDLPDLAASCWKAPVSSGSTGRPKVVRAAAPARVDPTRVVAPFVPHRAVQLVSGPLFHAAPFVYALRGLMTGHELVVMPRFDAADWLRLVVAHRVTWGMLVPTTMRRILEVPGRTSYDVSSLEAVLHLGARCPAQVKRAWLDWLGPDRVVEVYAGTESQGIACIGGRDWLQRRGSVGRGVGGTRFRVIRPDGSDCAPGETGEIVMRREAPTYHYVGEVPRVRDGWHTLGDSGWLDEDGYLFVADRLDDVIVTGGSKVHPADVEEVLEEHPGVRSAVVVGRPDDDLGERVHAVVEGTADENELRAWVRERLEPERRPRSYQNVDAPLRDDTGKVRRSTWR